jgi:light-regulated signal transduction histidine kinase (bacteriophytochrome)
VSRSNGELEQFAYVASHDLQEPLRMVASYLQLIERRYQDQLDKDGVEFIGYAVDGAKRMQSLINDLLLFARIGTKGNAFAAVDCNAVMAKVLHDLHLAIEESGANVVLGELPAVQGDDVLLAQLFRNLLGNALKFRSEAPPQVEVRARRADAEQSWEFVVRDNGIGIEPRYFDQIFRLFHRLHTRTAYPGNGIGLSVCKKIVERHGGQIWVQSQAGHGTAFSFTIPDRARLPAGGDGGEGNAS